ncbi:ABC transporter permease [Leekyejoonella antrihumi]|uniref:ABC transporter permease n=2 Tax=Leekyejoonella antrihumi TaxID=1660198 RepID=A0A563E644_9MICO|nr:ABC transporter permease [Leekyejoonella antrihumi]
MGPNPGPVPGDAPVIAGAAVDEPTGGPVDGEARSMFRLGLEVFVQNRLAVVGAGVIVFFLLFCFVGPLIYHTDQVHTNLMLSNGAPGGAHPFGTDASGYDELGRLMYGGQASLEVGLAAAVLASVVGTLYGAIAGYLGGWVDSVMMRLVDGGFAIPPLFLLLVLSAIFHPNRWEMIVIIAALSWLGAARLVRGEALSLRVREYVQAVRVMGGSSMRAVLKHVAPNAIGTVVVFASFAVADAILLLAFLGYLGLGLQPPQTDWGGMLSDAINYINSGYWWLLYPPGIAIILVAISFNFLGDALRDAFEVRLRGR